MNKNVNDITSRTAYLFMHDLIESKSPSLSWINLFKLSISYGFEKISSIPLAQSF